MNIVDLLVAAFAVYRLSYAIAVEEGPFRAFARARHWLGGDVQTTWIGRGVACPLCVSFWLAALAALIVDPTVLAWLGIAGMAALILKIGRY
jgi:hypothetical protein